MNNSAYEAGRVMGAVLAFVVVAALVLSGWRARRASQRARQAAELTAAQQGVPVDPTYLPSVRGSKRIGIGLTLLVLIGMGQVGRLAEKANDRSELDGIRVALPSRLLDLDRNDAVFADKLALVRSSLPPDVDQFEAGYFGSTVGGLFVGVAKAHIEDPKELADELLDRPLSTNERYVSAPAPIDAGALGGYGRCATVTQSEPAPGTAYLCILVSTTSLVMTTDSVAETLDDAAVRARRVRTYVVRAVDNPLPPESPAPSPTPTSVVTLRLPAALLGAKIQRKDLAEDRAAFIKETKGSFTQADLALYVGSSKAFFVETAAADLRLRSVFLRSYEKAAARELGSSLGRRTTVPAGPLGGDGYCWNPKIDGEPAYVCLFVDDQAYVAVYDLDSTSLASAAKLGRSVRAVVEKRR